MRIQCICAILLDLILADDRDVVFGLAGDRRTRAADAGVHVDRHAPCVRIVRIVSRGGSKSCKRDVAVGLAD